MAASPGGAAPRRATRIAFLILGVVSAAWAPLVPELKLRLGLDDAELGLMLLGVGGGGFAVIPVAGLAAGRLGCRTVILGAGTLFCAMLPVLTVVPGVAASAAALVVFGASIALIDVAANAQAVLVERAAGRPMMSGFHGLFSFGALLGAVLISLLLRLGLDSLEATAAIAGAALLALWAQAPGLLPRVEAAAARFRLPHGRLVLIGALCFIGFMAEGAVHDWSAVLLRFNRGTDPAAAGLAYAAFATAMTVMRLTGDALLRRVAPVRVLRWGALLACAGFLAMAALPSFAAAILGCAMIGLGAANIVPVLFSAAARTKGMSPGMAISAAASPGYVGLLAGPALIGLAANLAGLPMALAGAGLLLLAVAATARIAIAEDRHA